MKIPIVTEDTPNAMRLIGVGYVIGTPAAEIEVGDTITYNYGETSVVVAIVSETACTITVLVKTQAKWLPSVDKTYERTYRKTRLVCVTKPKK